MGDTDWSEWHAAYARHGSGLGDRLSCVREHIRRHLDATSPTPVRVISACAGDGRDLLGVLDGRADVDRVSGLLVEIDEGLARVAGDRADRLTGGRVQVRCADAACSRVYADATPADLVVVRHSRPQVRHT